jgi:hypothetical protein
MLNKPFGKIFNFHTTINNKSQFTTHTYYDNCLLCEYDMLFRSTKFREPPRAQLLDKPINRENIF